MTNPLESPDTPDWAKDALARHEAPILREYLLLDRPEEVDEELPVDSGESIEEVGGDEEHGGKRKRRKHGQNKTSERKDNLNVINNNRQLCVVVARGGRCAFGDECKFNHDVKAYWAEVG